MFIEQQIRILEGLGSKRGFFKKFFKQKIKQKIVCAYWLCNNELTSCPGGTNCFLFGFKSPGLVGTVCRVSLAVLVVKFVVNNGLA